MSTERGAGRVAASAASGIAACAAGALAVAAAVAGFEAVSRWGSRAELPAEPPASGREAIVVLGCPMRRDGRPSRMQRFRTRVAVRSRSRDASRSVLFFTGRTLAHRRRISGPGAARSEAEVMARLAIGALGVDPRDVVVEPEATTTWRNVEHTVPLVREFGADRIVIASTPLHALRARRMLRVVAPDLAASLARADDARPGEAVWLRVLDLAYEVRGYVYWSVIVRDPSIRPSLGRRERPR